MNTAKLDIVIPLKATDDNEELRYVLRSIAVNLPHHKIYLSGYKPSWVQNVEYVHVRPVEGNKYSKSGANIRKACHDPRITDNFILFADDIFVMKPITEIQPMHRGKLADFADLYDKLDSKYGQYRDAIHNTESILKDLGITNAVSYELHVPMVFNKAKRLAVTAINRSLNPNGLHIHSNTLYGNLFEVGGEEIADVKIFRIHEAPEERLKDSPFISSSNESFRDGLVGKYIRDKFQDKCKYEV